MTKKQVFLLSLLLCPLSYQSSTQARVGRVVTVFTTVGALAAGEMYGFKKGQEAQFLPENQGLETLFAFMALRTLSDGLTTASQLIESASQNVKNYEQQLFPAATPALSQEQAAPSLSTTHPATDSQNLEELTHAAAPASSVQEDSTSEH